MFFECKVYDPKGNLKEVISAEELSKRHWENADEAYGRYAKQEFDYSAPPGNELAEMYEQAKLIMYTCEVCMKGGRTNTENKRYCSAECKEVAKKERAAEKKRLMI
jgi:hypothetical protein